MALWQSPTIAVKGIEVQVHASADGVDLGKVVDGVYSSDLLLTPDQARRLARALLQGADEAEDAA